MTVHFPELARLLEYDEARVQRVVWEFYRSSIKDLHNLEQATVAQHWQVARQLARRIQVSCLQVGERDAANAAADLISLPGDRFADAYRQSRVQIIYSLDRAEEFVGHKMAGRESSLGSQDASESRH
ncbi:hypothetical protein LC55x_5328 [Lysobacter capsici]|uniref:hypothetical protein n=1 Tax=Lysobacter capsici TaxID=435897 RepID=UPI00071F7228|nr:hypothetical protein [Lysobacter capsici]ALN88574.1 hypothetical protein LC55x_5328 [Lysobacter capsici]